MSYNRKEGIIMVQAKEIAKYFLTKDKNNKLFTKKLVNINGHDCYEGNVRLNKYLYFAQTVYLAKYGELLFENDIVAYDNGPVIKEVMNDYSAILANKNNCNYLEEKTKIFLDKIYKALEGATCDELIEIAHEDTAWKELSAETYKSPVIDILKYKEKYENQYKGLIKVMEI
jgi:uncharacterized phage-associated protein